MKAKRRHELKQNVLDQELGKGIEFLKKRASYIAWGLLIIALIVLIAVWTNARRRKALAELRSEYQQLTSGQVRDPKEQLDGLIRLSQQNRDERIAALSSVAVGDIYSSQLIAGGQALPAADRVRVHNDATQFYRKTIEQYADQPDAVARAYYGLGVLAENDRDFVEASNAYEAAAAAVSEGQPLRKLALEAIERLKELRTPVRMAATASAPAEPEEPTTAPATQPATAPTE